MWSSISGEAVGHVDHRRSPAGGGGGTLVDAGLRPEVRRRERSGAGFVAGALSQARQTGGGPAERSGHHDGVARAGPAAQHGPPVVGRARDGDGDDELATG